jgi:hypothetical protein
MDEPGYSDEDDLINDYVNEQQDFDDEYYEEQFLTETAADDLGAVEKQQQPTVSTVSFSNATPNHNHTTATAAAATTTTTTTAPATAVSPIFPPEPEDVDNDDDDVHNAREVYAERQRRNTDVAFTFERYVVVEQQCHCVKSHVYSLSLSFPLTCSCSMTLFCFSFVILRLVYYVRRIIFFFTQIQSQES